MYVAADGVLVVTFVIQSNGQAPMYLDGKIEEFIDEFENTLNELTIDSLENSINSLISQVMEVPQTSIEDFSRLYSAINARTYDFQDDDLEFVRAVANVTKDQLLGVYNEYLKADAPQRVKFVSGVVADAHGKELFGEEYVNDWSGYKGPDAFDTQSIMDKLQVDRSRGEIICIQDSKLFRENSEYFPTLIETLEASL